MDCGDSVKKTGNMTGKKAGKKIGKRTGKRTGKKKTRKSPALNGDKRMHRGARKQVKGDKETGKRR